MSSLSNSDSYSLLQTEKCISHFTSTYIFTVFNGSSKYVISEFNCSFIQLNILTLLFPHTKECDLLGGSLLEMELLTRPTMLYNGKSTWLNGGLVDSPDFTIGLSHIYEQSYSRVGKHLEKLIFHGINGAKNPSFLVAICFQHHILNNLKRFISIFFE